MYLKEGLTYLLASGCEARVSSNSTLDVELALSMAAQVDGAWSDVDVHEVVDNPALDVVQHPVDQVPLTHIHYFNVGEIPERWQIKPSGQQSVMLQSQNCVYFNCSVQLYSFLTKAARFVKKKKKIILGLIIITISITILLLLLWTILQLR